MKRRLRSTLGQGLFGLLLPLCNALSWGTAQSFGRALGTLGYVLATTERRRALDHLGIAFPDLAEDERRGLARACFRHLGTSLAECLHLFHKGCAGLAEHVEAAGWEYVEAARSTGRPLLLFTGHCGNWELLAAAVNCRGIEMAVVARQLAEPGLQDRLLDFRARFGTTTIERGTRGAARSLLEVFRRRGALGMIIDQDTRVDGVWVPFLGRPAYTPIGAAEIALRKDCVVLPIFIERRPDGSHLARFEPPLELPDDPAAATARMSERIEVQIRRRPEQWVWMHRRWRRRPPPGA